MPVLPSLASRCLRPLLTLGLLAAAIPVCADEARIDALLARMALEDKIGQMTLVERSSLRPGDITRYRIGGVLNGAGDAPEPNSAASWRAMTAAFQQEALATPLAIPLLHGVDAVHGHGHLKDATVFPHNIALGAADDVELTEAVARATAEEMLATGLWWNFAPALSIPRDARWGRVYEAFGEDTELVARHGAAWLRGAQRLRPDDQAGEGQQLLSLGTAKHFIGDGATAWGSSTTGDFQIDRGDMRDDEATLRRIDLPPYRAAIEAGALSVMASFSSWQGVPLHGHRYLLTDVLKGELGFKGFVVSDWGGIDAVRPGDYRGAVVTAVNAGVDMVMVPADYPQFTSTLLQAVRDGAVSEARIDDAVRRILRAKLALGLQQQALPSTDWQASIRSPQHLNLARQVVQRSLVLLQNREQTLPLAQNLPLLRVAGPGADDIGLQSGGWTLEWQGQPGNHTAGATILDGVRALAGNATTVEYSASGEFTATTRADACISVLAEAPYAEGVGDRADISLNPEEIALLQRMQAQCARHVVLLLAGRPRLISAQLGLADAWVMGWLPGSEGAAVADVLFGVVPFSGRLPVSWPRSAGQLPLNLHNSSGKTGCDAPLFPLGHGLRAGQQWLATGECR